MAAYTLQGFTNDASSADLDATNINEMDNAIKIGHDFADGASATPAAGKAMVWGANAIGTFDPHLYSNGVESVITYLSKKGSYRILGGVLFFSLDINASVLNATSGNLKITGLPFANNDDDVPFHCVSIGFTGGVNANVLGLIYYNASTITLFKKTATSPNYISELARTDIASSNVEITISGFYPVS